MPSVHKNSFDASLRTRSKLSAKLSSFIPRLLFVSIVWKAEEIKILKNVPITNSTEESIIFGLSFIVAPFIWAEKCPAGGRGGLFLLSYN